MMQDDTPSSEADTSKYRGKAPAPSTSAAARDGRRFQRELRSMMFGFGDDRQPQAESVQLLEDMVVDYVQTLLQHAQQASEHRTRGTKRAGEAKVRERDLLFVLRKDCRRQERIVELLEVWKEVKAARGVGDDPKGLDKLETW